MATDLQRGIPGQAPPRRRKPRVQAGIRIGTSAGGGVHNAPVHTSAPKQQHVPLPKVHIPTSHLKGASTPQLIKHARLLSAALTNILARQRSLSLSITPSTGPNVLNQDNLVPSAGLHLGPSDKRIRYRVLKQGESHVRRQLASVSRELDLRKSRHPGPADAIGSAASSAWNQLGFQGDPASQAGLPGGVTSAPTADKLSLAAGAIPGLDEVALGGKGAELLGELFGPAGKAASKVAGKLPSRAPKVAEAGAKAAEEGSPNAVKSAIDSAANRARAKVGAAGAKAAEKTGLKGVGQDIRASATAARSRAAARAVEKGIAKSVGRVPGAKFVGRHPFLGAGVGSEAIAAAQGKPGSLGPLGSIGSAAQGVLPGVLGNAAGDVIDLPAAIPSSALMLGIAAAQQYGSGDTHPLTDFGKSFVAQDPVIQAAEGVVGGLSGAGTGGHFKQALTNLENHPVYGALELAGIRAAAGHAAGHLGATAPEARPPVFAGGGTPDAGFVTTNQKEIDAANELNKAARKAANRAAQAHHEATATDQAPKQEQQAAAKQSDSAPTRGDVVGVRDIKKGDRIMDPNRKGEVRTVESVKYNQHHAAIEFTDGPRSTTLADAKIQRVGATPHRLDDSPVVYGRGPVNDLPADTPEVQKALADFRRLGDKGPPAGPLGSASSLEKAAFATAQRIYRYESRHVAPKALGLSDAQKRLYEEASKKGGHITVTDPSADARLIRSLDAMVKKGAMKRSGVGHTGRMYELTTKPVPNPADATGGLPDARIVGEASGGAESVTPKNLKPGDQVFDQSGKLRTIKAVEKTNHTHMRNVVYEDGGHDRVGMSKKITRVRTPEVVARGSAAEPAPASPLAATVEKKLSPAQSKLLTDIRENPGKTYPDSRKATLKALEDKGLVKVKWGKPGTKVAPKTVDVPEPRKVPVGPRRGAVLGVRGHYSRDPMLRAVQKKLDARQIEKYGRGPDAYIAGGPNTLGERVTSTIHASPAQYSSIYDNAGTMRISTGRTLSVQGRDQINHDIVKAVKGVSKENQAVAELMIRRILANPEVSQSDLESYLAQVKAEEKNLTRPEHVAASRETQAVVEKALKNLNPEGLAKVVDGFLKAQEPVVKKMLEKDLITEDQNARASRLHFAQSHMGAKYGLPNKLAEELQTLESKLKGNGGEGVTPKENARLQLLRRNVRGENNSLNVLLRPDGTKMETSEIDLAMRAAGVPFVDDHPQVGYVASGLSSADTASSWFRKPKTRPAGFDVGTGKLTGAAVRKGIHVPSIENVIGSLQKQHTLYATAREVDELVHHVALGIPDRNGEISPFANKTKAREALTNPDAHNIDLHGRSPQDFVLFQPTSQWASAEERRIAAEQGNVTGAINFKQEQQAGGPEQSMLAHAVKRGLDASGDGPVYLLPVEVAKQLTDSFQTRPEMWRLAEGATGWLKRAWLPTSPNWLIGNAVDNYVIRSAGTGLRYAHFKAGKQIANVLNQTDEGTRALTNMTGQGMFGASTDQQIFHNPDSYTGKVKRWNDLRLKVADSPPARAVLDKFQWYSHNVSDWEHRIIENPPRRAELSRQTGKWLNLTMRQMNKALKAQDPALIDFIQHGLSGDRNVQLHFAQEVEKTLGNWVRLSPGQRQLGLVMAPFWTWARAALKFTFITMPVHHPILTAIYADMAAMTRQERQYLGLVPGKNDPLPAYRQGAVPLPGGGMLGIQHYTSYGYTADLGSNVAGVVLPQGKDILNAFQGQDPFGNPLYNGPQDFYKNLEAAGAAFGFSVVPFGNEAHNVQRSGLPGLNPFKVTSKQDIASERYYNQTSASSYLPKGTKLAPGVAPPPSKSSSSSSSGSSWFLK